MRRYETIIIIDPDLSDEGRGPVLDRVMELIKQYKGTLILVDEWGSKNWLMKSRKRPADTMSAWTIAETVPW